MGSTLLSPSQYRADGSALAFQENIYKQEKNEVIIQ